MMRKTGTGQSAEISIRQAIVPLVFVSVLAAQALALQQRFAQARTKAAAEMVDTALVLAVDVSESINAERYALQMAGIAKTFEDPDIQQMILSGPNHSMFVALRRCALRFDF